MTHDWTDHPPLETTTFPPVLDSTMRSAWLTCPHYFLRRHCQGLTTSDDISVHLHFGATFASGLEAARRSYWAGSPQSAAVVDGADAIVKAWGSYTFNPTKRSEEVKSLDNCLLALTDYFRQWPLDTDAVRIHEFEGEPCIEFSGSWPIGILHPETGDDIVYAGRFDLIGDRTDLNNEVWGLDDKTGRISDNPEKWTMRGQFTGYCWLASKYGLPLKGFLVREVQPLTASIKLNQAVTSRPQWMVDRWFHQLQCDVYDMLDAWQAFREQPGGDESAFSRVLDSGCYTFNRPCEFTPLCNAEYPERWLDTYHVRRWDPLVREADTE